jgi:aspartate/methionine/tyrosine aminotransferase
MKTLTDYEIQGLNSPCNLADGHAYHFISEIATGFESSLPLIWAQSEVTSVGDAETRFLEAFARLIDVPQLVKHTGFRFAPTSSNSIDIAAAYLAENAPRVLLVEPTFDNLALLLRRRGCKLISLDEDLLHAALAEDRVGDLLAQYEFDALFLVNPNNPSGKLISRYAFASVVDHCGKAGKLLVLDSTFRLYAKTPIADYPVLLNSDAEYIVIEDTGKTWPTHDLKASLMVYSKGLQRALEIIVDEIYLCHSRFSLLMFAQLFDVTRQQGISETIHLPIARRHALLQSALAQTPLQAVGDRARTQMPLEWIATDNLGPDSPSLRAQALFAKHGVHVLPGRPFYWSGGYKDVNFIRVSLAKPLDQVRRSIDRLQQIWCPTDV